MSKSKKCHLGVGVERADINSVLMQMRMVKSQIQPTSMGMQPNMVTGVTQAAPEVGRVSFTEILKNAVDSVNDTQGVAKKMAEAYERGDSNIDLPQVMIASEKASISFQAMTQVRNKLVSAYEDVMKMPI